MIKRDDSVTHVLCVGNDSALLSTRELILARAGYHVCPVPDAKITEHSDLFSFDVVLFCHSIASDRAERISRLVRSWNPNVLTIQLTNAE